MNLFLFLLIFVHFFNILPKKSNFACEFFEDFFSVIKYITHFLKMSITFVKEFVLPLTLFSLDYKQQTTF